jgi:hypothetical protein
MGSVRVRVSGGGEQQRVGRDEFVGQGRGDRDMSGSPLILTLLDCSS